jgi:hypothetical protein
MNETLIVVVLRWKKTIKKYKSTGCTPSRLQFNLLHKVITDHLLLGMVGNVAKLLFS